METTAELDDDEWWNDPNIVCWDWKSRPDFPAINSLLRPYGVQIIDINTEGDTYAVRVERI